jgi:CRP-like cAMP-binding protein
MSQIDLLFRNRLLRRLSDGARERLGAMEPVELALRDRLEVAGEPIRFVYFLETGLASVVAEVPGSGSIEVGMIGSEGVTAVALVEHDVQSPFDTFMQVAGTGHRIEAARLTEALRESAEIRRLFLLYARSFSIQLASTAMANGKSKLEARLARWLLMVADRVGGTFNVTHEFLALMLAVRRSGVTLAMQLLEGHGLIRSTRGTVTIIDRAALIAHADGAYGLPEREYKRLLGEA